MQSLGRILAGADGPIAEGPIRLAVRGEITTAPFEGQGDRALYFGPGAELSWVAEGLMSHERGAVLLDFAYSTATSYSKDEPVLRVADRAGRTVFSVTIGRVLFKVSRPPYEFAIDLYQNEREGSWLRTAIVWERIDEPRMYMRVAINDRPYDRAIVLALPDGPLSFSIAPEKVLLREVAFFDRPVPMASHPHVNRTACLDAEAEEIRRLAFISQREQRELDERGGVVVFVPCGATTGGLPSALRTMGLTRFRLADEESLGEALKPAATLILPDSDHWPLDARRDRAVAEYLASGGGVLALGASCAVLRNMGIADFQAHPTPSDGAISFRLNHESPLLRSIPGGWGTRERRVTSFSRRGPGYILPERADAPLSDDLTQLSFAAAMRCSKGRLALCSAYPFGIYFCRPAYQLTAGVRANALAYLIFKALLLYAAGAPFSRDANSTLMPRWNALPVWVPEGTSPTSAAAQIPLAPGPKSLGEEESFLVQDLRVGRSGCISVWLKADTLNLSDADPRSIFCLSDGGENRWHCYYDPRDQFLVLMATTPNEESLTVVRERTSWSGREWRHLALAWRATATNDAAIEMFIDGHPVASGGAPLPTAPFRRLVLGALPGMRGLCMTIREPEVGDRPDWSSIRARTAPAISWEDSLEELSQLRRFQQKRRLALLAVTHPLAYLGKKTFEVHGLHFDVLFEKDLAEDALKRYDVIYVPGGGPPQFSEPLAMQEKIRQFVRSGGGYVGICAGMNEASSQWPPDKAANLFSAPLADAVGTDLMEVQLEGGHPILRGVPVASQDKAPRVRFMHMCGAPVRMDAPGLQVRAVAMVGNAPSLAAAVSFVYGKGRGVVWATHPEADRWAWWKASDRTRAAIRRLFRNSVYFAGGELPDLASE